MDFAALTNTVLDFIRQHPNWAAVFVFALAFGESLPLASLVLPFWAVLVGVGAVIAVADPLIFWTIVVAAAIGAAMGDWLSYWIGYHYHARLQADVAAEEVPQAIGQRPVVLQTLGCAGHCHIPFFRTAARQCAHRGRYRGNGMATFSIGQLEFGFPMGFCFAVTRGMGPQMVDPTHWVITSTWRASSTFPLQP